MDGIKREELKKACKKIHKVRARMAAVRMVQVLDMSVEETAIVKSKSSFQVQHIKPETM